MGDRKAPGAQELSVVLLPWIPVEVMINVTLRLSDSIRISMCAPAQKVSRTLCSSILEL